MEMMMFCIRRGKLLISLVPGAGIEPARYFYRGILSPKTPRNSAFFNDLTRFFAYLVQISETKWAQKWAQWSFGEIQAWKRDFQYFNTTMSSCFPLASKTLNSKGNSLLRNSQILQHTQRERFFANSKAKVEQCSKP